MSRLLLALSGIQVMGRGRWRELRSLVGLRRATEMARRYALLARHQLFEPDWYMARYHDLAGKVADPLLHFLVSGWREGRDPGARFDVHYYRTRHADVARSGVDPLLHYLSCGKAERRSAVRPPPGSAAAPLPETPPAAPEPTPPAAAAWPPPLPDLEAATRLLAERRPLLDWPRLAPGAAVTVFAHARGNHFMTDIARLVTAGFAGAGFQARLADEADWPGTAALRCVVAPHEFFHLPAAGGRPLPAGTAAGALLINVEQLHTPWFAQGQEALRHARAVLDISLLSAAQLAAAGYPAQFLALGGVPGHGVDRGPLPDLPALATLEPAIKAQCPPPGAPLGERPLDILFIGYLSERRAEILGRMAERLARWRCHFLLTENHGPLVEGANAPLDSASARGLAARAKIVLNLHQSETPFFEWHRIALQALWMRALPVSEPTAPAGPLQAGRDYLAAPLDELPDLLDWLLATPQGQAEAERVRNEGWQRLNGPLRLDHALRGLFAEGAP